MTMTNAKNTGCMSIITVGDVSFEIDGYFKKSIAESVCSNRTVLTLTWSNLLENELALSESNFIEDKNGNVLEVEVVDIDPYERRTFNNQAEVAEAIERFMKEVK